MHRILKTIIVSALLFAAVFSGTVVANAAATNLPPSLLIGDEKGIKVGVDGEYYIDLWVEAGDVFTKKLTISNYEPYSYKITMSAEPLEETGPLKLLNEINLKLELDGKPLYNGRVRGDEDVNMIVNALDLGTYDTGTVHVLDITLHVNPEMKKYFWLMSEARCKWIFKAARVVDDKPPPTGEIVTYLIYGLVAMMAVTMLLLIIIVKKRQRERDTKQG